MSWTAPLKNHSKERASLTPIKAKKAGVGNADWGLAMTVAASERCSQWPPAGVRLGAGSLLPQSKIPETAGEFQPFTLAQPLRPVCGIAATPAAIVSVFLGDRGWSRFAAHRRSNISGKNSAWSGLASAASWGRPAVRRKDRRFFGETMGKAMIRGEKQYFAINVAFTYNVF